jgi:nickel/cobalt transporter (NicO) family protein
LGFVAEGAGQVPDGPDSNVGPCTGAILVLVFALTQGVFWAGVVATFAKAIGTAITVAAPATLALGSRELALRLGGRSGAFADAV